MIWFTFAEFGAEKAPERIRANVEHLCRFLLDPLRAELGHPIRINSGYRTAEHNRRVGGVPNSDHLHGCAADCVVLGLPFEDSVRRVREVLESGRLPFDQFIIYPRFFHLSYRHDRPNRGMILHKVG